MYILMRYQNFKKMYNLLKACNFKCHVSVASIKSSLKKQVLFKFIIILKNCSYVMEVSTDFPSNQNHLLGSLVSFLCSRPIHQVLAVCSPLIWPIVVEMKSRSRYFYLKINYLLSYKAPGRCSLRTARTL